MAPSRELGPVSRPWLDALYRKGAIVTSSTGANAEPVAQTGFTGLLMLARRFTHYVQAQRRHEWQPLRGARCLKTCAARLCCCLASARSAKFFAGYAKAFGLNVIGVRRTPNSPAILSMKCIRLHDCRSCCRVRISSWSRVRSRRRRAICSMRARSQRMRKGACVINIARGEIVDDGALIERLAKRSSRRRAHRRSLGGAAAGRLAALGFAECHRDAAQCRRLARSRKALRRDVHRELRSLGSRRADVQRAENDAVTK